MAYNIYIIHTILRNFFSSLFFVWNHQTPSHISAQRGLRLEAEKLQDMKRSRFGIVGMTYQSSLMMHLLALYIPRLHVMEGRPDAWCFSICSLGVMMLTHHATTKAQSHRKSHASHHSGMFIFKNDSEQSHHLHPPPQLIIQGGTKKKRKKHIWQTGAAVGLYRRLQETEDQYAYWHKSQSTCTAAWKAEQTGCHHCNYAGKSVCFKCLYAK